MNLLGRLYHGETTVDFVGKRNIWFALSGLLLIVSLLAMPLRPANSSCSPPLPSYFKGLNCGIEFKGGISVEAPIKDTSDLANLDDLAVIQRIRDELAPFGASDAQVQVATADDGTRNVIVQTSAVGEASQQEQVADAIRKVTGATVEESPRQQIGRKWGGEITSKAVKALIIFFLVIVAFISWRFEWKMAVGAFVALFHDLVITAGVYALIGFEVTPSTVIAILTILGYSLYDTVVVFDKVEENTNMYATTGKMTYEASTNLAMNQVFMRSLNTSLATLLPVAALLFVGAGLLGATTLEDLALALFVGILVGTYSSIFVASPVLTLLKEREPRFKSVREKVLRDAKRAGANRPAETVEEAREEVTVGAPATTASSTPRTTAQKRPQNRPRAGSKKAKRRKKR
jgi:preprotein translocase subunit SecF